MQYESIPIFLKFSRHVKEAATKRCSVKKMFLEILQNSQENSCARVSFLKKIQTETCNFIKKKTLAQVFSCEFCEILRTPFCIEHLGWPRLTLYWAFRILTIYIHNEIKEISKE